MASLFAFGSQLGPQVLEVVFGGLKWSGFVVGGFEFGLIFAFEVVWVFVGQQPTFDPGFLCEGQDGQLAVGV